MAKKIVIFQFFKNCQFSNLHCFLLEIICALVPAIKLVSILCTFDRVSIFGSILYLSLDNRKNCQTITIEMFKSEISVTM